MNALFITLVVLIVLAAILLILVVLLQNGKGEGMVSNFVAGNQTFGVRQTADILEKITWGLVIFIVVASVAASFSTNVKGNAVDISSEIENVDNSNMQFPVEGVQVDDPSVVQTPTDDATPATDQNTSTEANSQSSDGQ